MIKKNLNGTFIVDISLGRNKRIRKRFKTRTEATRYERHAIGQMEQDKDWTSESKDIRKLSELINIWYQLHGSTLKDGARVRNRLLIISERMGNPIASDVDNNSWVKYRAKRLEDATPKTLNNEQGFIIAVYNKLFELGETNYGSKINNVKKIKITERKVKFLTDIEIKDLIEVIKHEDTKQAVKLCLSTGARWGEVKRLQVGQLVDNKLTLNSKSTKNRTIPIKEELAQQITPPLMASEKLFKKGIQAANIKLDKGQNTHILRHTFASHFTINGGNILTLQRILGHSDIRMTMIYSHLAPDHLEEAKKYAPL
jgi:integrase